MEQPAFTVGIEEEYLLVDLETRDLAKEPPEEMLTECEELSGGQVSPEFLRAQIEVGTRVCATMAEAREDLAGLRRTIVEVAGKHGLAPIAASTHPFATWQNQSITNRDRYHALNRDMQASARRLVICGMHVHVGLGDDDLRIDLMNQFAYFLPHLLALSCSSPFWEGENTGLQSYRLTVFDGMPRTRLPDPFASYAEYLRHVEILVGAGLLEDASKIWWDVRPSSRYPTLEMRITDVCTLVDDSVAIATLTACIMSMLYRLRNENKRWRTYSQILVNENRWRAMRYGPDEGLVDFSKAAIVPYAELLDEIIEMVRPDAVRMDCVKELESARDIIERGTSARQQIEAYDAAIAAGGDKHAGHRAVVDKLVEMTRTGL
ncbi:MAG: carboxylate-amine ligase [Pseudomonadota bacterium]